MIITDSKVPDSVDDVLILVERDSLIDPRQKVREYLVAFFEDKKWWLSWNADEVDLSVWRVINWRELPLTVVSMSEQLELFLNTSIEPRAGEYLVVKNTDIDQYLSVSERVLFRFMADVVAARCNDAGEKEFKCIVIEHDHPVIRPTGISLEAILVAAIKQIPINYDDALGGSCA